MTSFVEACVETVAGSAQKVARKSRGRGKARRLLATLRGREKILVTTHMHPDPDALASSIAMRHLLRTALPGAKVELSIRGTVGGGVNEAFNRHVSLDAVPWNPLLVRQYDAVVLLDVQPNFAYNPLPEDVNPTAVIDHHRSRGRRPKAAFVDIRPDIGSTCSIIFSYFMELDLEIPPDLATTLLYGVESDLAGAAGAPATLDNMALSTLTLKADTQKLYQMRYVTLPRSYYAAYATGLASAMWYDDVLIAHLGEIDTPEKPAIIADFLLRFDPVHWTLVTATQGQKLILSLRTRSTARSAGDVMKRLVRGIGEGGGHRTKSGGFVPLTSVDPQEVEKLRSTIRRRLLRTLKIPGTQGQPLVPKS
ncbi:MAG: DHH family phosphoesterase [Phycisphaerae bacterium]|nr:DHH family phosphoesterase [Phycisphaerae bacterium]MDW8262192.1 DHH family phosphoesterase [Phycisphaerales bacterium]